MLCLGLMFVEMLQDFWPILACHSTFFHFVVDVSYWYCLLRMLSHIPFFCRPLPQVQAPSLISSTKVLKAGPAPGFGGIGFIHFFGETKPSPPTLWLVLVVWNTWLSLNKTHVCFHSSFPYACSSRIAQEIRRSPNPRAKGAKKMRCPVGMPTRQEPQLRINMAPWDLDIEHSQMQNLKLPSTAFWITMSIPERCQSKRQAEHYSDSKQSCRAWSPLVLFWNKMFDQNRLNQRKTFSQI